MRRLLSAVIVYSIFGVLMSVMWLLLEAPDLAITEAAVGVGISGLLFFLLLRRIGKVNRQRKEDPADE